MCASLCRAIANDGSSDKDNNNNNNNNTDESDGKDFGSSNKNSFRALVADVVGSHTVEVVLQTAPASAFHKWVVVFEKRKSNSGAWTITHTQSYICMHA